MPLLTTKETQDIIIEEVSRTSGSLQIISAFCKLDTIKNLIDKNVNTEVSSKKLLVRFRLEDLLTKASDIDLYEYCKSNGWELYIRFDLHAKTYIFDKKRCVLGSSNLTGRGFGLGIVGNVEFSGIFDVDENDIAKIEMLFDNSLKVDDELFLQLKEEYEKAKSQLTPNTNIQNCTWSKKVYDKLVPNLKVMFSYDFPSTSKPIFDDPDSFAFMDCPFPASEEAIRNAFMHCNCYLWLKKTLKGNNNCLYFGSATKLLHDAMFSDPKPYRKDIKEYLSNLLSWIVFLQIDDIKIDKPNYSQRIRLI